MIDNRRSPFDKWIVENYGFDANYRVLTNKPPKFVRADGMFDVSAYERWMDNKREEFDL